MDSSAGGSGGRERAGVGDRGGRWCSRDKVSKCVVCPLQFDVLVSSPISSKKHASLRASLPYVIVSSSLS